MARTLDELRNEALTLGVEERGALADSIWESFLTDEEREIQTAWIVEAERRLEDLRSGKVKGVPWEDVKARLLAKYDADSHLSRRR
jgi:putative addiction module component (TIGR02574 family)